MPTPASGRMTDLKPSFTRGMFAGAVHDDLLFPYPPPLSARDPGEARLVGRLIADLHEFRDSGLLDPALIDDQEAVPESLIRALAERGFMGLSIPRAYGGLGLSATGYARVFAAVASLDASLGVLLGVHCGLGSKAIVLFGTEEQKARYLPMLARGETLAAYALTEPATGSDAQHITTRASQRSDGAWVLNGRKIWIGNGQRAGVIATFAQTETASRRGGLGERPTAFIIRPDMPGFKVAGTVRKLGIRGSTQAELEFTELVVPADHVLGMVGKGFAVAVHVLNAGRLSLAAGCTAGIKRLLGEMASYSEQRIQFGRPIAAFEITQRKLAAVACDAYAADAMLGLLTSLADRGDADYALEAACCKVFASDALWRAADEMVQVAGGRGFVRPYPYERMLRDARINRIFEGTNEILRLFIALNGIQGPAERLREIGSALRRPLRHLGLISGFAASRVRSRLGNATETFDVPLHARLEQHKTFLEKHVAELRLATERMIQRHRKDIVERQLVLERLANMAVELYATAAVIARTQRLISEHGIDACQREVALCDLFCVEAGRRFRDAKRGLEHTAEDDRRRAIASAVREGQGYVVADALLDDPAPAPQQGAEAS
ncbi:MAG: hypothetical protein NVS4B3_14180 [Gemmatimonadaceae bacterium]